MKKLTDIIEATSTIHPNAVHVKPVQVGGETKYKVHAVGKNFSDGIKVGEHLSDSELDDFHEMGGKIKHIKEDVDQVTEGEEAHAQFQKYHKDTAVLLKNINAGLSKHYDNVTNKKGYNNGEAHWGHVGDIKNIHRQLQDIHDSILQQGEYAKPPKMVKEDVEPEADQNILVQLRKCVDILEHGTQGGANVTFGDGETMFVEGTVAVKLVEALEGLKPETRAEVTEYLYQTHDNLVGVYNRLK